MWRRLKKEAAEEVCEGCDGEERKRGAVRELHLEHAQIDHSVGSPHRPPTVHRESAELKRIDVAKRRLKGLKGGPRANNPAQINATAIDEEQYRQRRMGQRNKDRLTACHVSLSNSFTALVPCLDLVHINCGVYRWGALCAQKVSPPPSALVASTRRSGPPGLKKPPPWAPAQCKSEPI